MSIILKNSSFGLIRTNPALTTNIKIVTDGDKVYLESIDADPVLSDSKYKKFEVTGGLYSADLFRFYARNGKLIPRNIAYKVYERDEYFSIKDSYSKQYDFTYCAGTEYKNSRLYTQEYCTFAPLWVEPSNIPDYFVIFKLRGPLTLKSDLGYDQNTSITLEELITNPDNLFENYIKNAQIVKTFDLTKKSGLGRYIRRYVEDKLFPKYPVLASIKKDDQSSWEGISYENGGFCKKTKSIYKDYTLLDKTITEKDNYITNGFFDQGVVLANILNLEFLFDDYSDSDYEFNRYFGLYVSESELGKFSIDKNTTQDYSNITGEQVQVEDFITNQNGVVLGLQLTEGSDLIQFDNSSPKFPYIKDVNGVFYSVNQNLSWPVGLTGVTGLSGDFIRIKSNSINLNDFYDYGVPFKYIDVMMSDINSPSCFSFVVKDSPALGDQIRIKHTDANQEITSSYTVTGVGGTNGTNEGSGFSVNGSVYDVAKAISNAINYIEVGLQKTQQFISTYTGNRVVVYTRTKNSYLNRINYTIFSSKSEFPFSLPNEFGTFEHVTNYIDYMGSTNLLVGNLFSYHFTGGTDNPMSKFRIKAEDLFETKDENDTIFIKNFIKTNEGFKPITDYAPYLDEPIKNTKGEIIGFNGIDDYVTCYVDGGEISVGVSKKLSLYKVQKNSNGFLSLFPIKDFDFDFYSTEYSKNADSDPLKLKAWYETSQSYLFGVSGATGTSGAIEIWYNNEFISNGGFKTLAGEIDDEGNLVNNIDCEYNRLQENMLTNLALESRVVPYINKWVYDNDARDVRENNYRLNVDQSFDYLNFSPSFSAKQPDAKLFTHEWYYLQKYPSYFTFEDKVNSFSYFEDEIDTSMLLDTESDYFLSYFTRETIGGTAIPRDFKYSIFEYSSDSTYPETLFRGAKVIVKDRFEYSHLDNNVNSKKFITNPKYNDYKFSSILTFSDIGSIIEVIKNDKFKNITLVVKAALNDPFLWNSDYDIDNSSRFIDRSILYTISNNYKVEDNKISIVDKQLSGVIKSWGMDNGLIKVTLTPDIDGRYPNVVNELTLDSNTSLYNDITIKDTTNITGEYYLKQVKFEGITKCDLTSFWCKSIKYTNDLESVTFDTLDVSSGSILGFVSIDFTGTNIMGDNIPTEFLYSSEYEIVKQRIKKFILTTNPIYLNGGSKGLENIIKEISFASIVEKINNGYNEITYTSIDENGNISYDTFALELVKPVDEITSSYIKVDNVTRDTSYLQNFNGILGYELASKKRTSLFPISRQKGGYAPKFKNLIDFVDINGDPYYENTRIYKNSYGIISNLYYNKVNVENANGILKLVNLNKIYPYLGEIAIDKKDFFIFKSNFDPLYHVTNLTAIKNSTMSGLIESKEAKSFFGSKVLSTPYTIKIDTFDGLVDKTLLGNTNIYSTDYKVVKSYDNIDKANILTLSVFVDKLLLAYLINDGIGKDFYEYLNSSYISEKTMDEFIQKYIKDNILDKYIIKEIVFWEKIYPKGAVYNEVEISLSDQEKLTRGYSKSKSFSVTYNSGLNFDLKYNIPVDKNYSISFTIELEKK